MGAGIGEAPASLSASGSGSGVEYPEPPHPTPHAIITTAIHLDMHCLTRLPPKSFIVAQNGIETLFRDLTDRLSQNWLDHFLEEKITRDLA